MDLRACVSNIIHREVKPHGIQRCVATKLFARARVIYHSRSAIMLSIYRCIILVSYILRVLSADLLSRVSFNTIPPSTADINPESPQPWRGEYISHGYEYISRAIDEQSTPRALYGTIISINKTTPNLLWVIVPEGITRYNRSATSTINTTYSCPSPPHLATPSDASSLDLRPLPNKIIEHDTRH